MFHVRNSEVYLTSSNAEGMSNGGNVAPMLGSEEPAVTPFSLYFSKISSENLKVNHQQFTLIERMLNVYQ